jgi:hypothetical protein
MSDDDAREYLDVVRRVLSRNGLSALDTDIFNSLFSAGDMEEFVGRNPTTDLRNYLERVEKYFSYFSRARFQEELGMLNQLTNENISDLDLVLDQQLMNQAGRLEGSQSLRGLLERFDLRSVLETVQRIQARIWDVNDDEPPPSNQQRPSGM